MIHIITTTSEIEEEKGLQLCFSKGLRWTQLIHQSDKRKATEALKENPQNTKSKFQIGKKHQHHNRHNDKCTSFAPESESLLV
jgi:hypothetical protein